MRRRAWAMAIAMAGAGLILANAACAQQPAPETPPARPDATIPPPVDYVDPASWICRPGVDDGTCSTHLDALTVDSAWNRTPRPYKAAADPGIDCFYVYPTAAGDTTMFAGMKPDAAVTRAVHGQAARLGSVCRLFVPIYHQITMTGLRYALTMRAEDQKAGIDRDPPYRDILAAWRDYLKRDNHGRGVVLIGHSQGAMILKRLLAEEVDGKPAQKLLVGAYLAGNDDLTSASFKALKPCAALGQTGCVVAWSSYLDEQQGARIFGGAHEGTALCVNPAAPAGGRGSLKAYLSKPSMAPANDPPYVELIGQLSAECVTDAAGTVLRIRIEPGEHAEALHYWLTRYSPRPGWGLHPLDVSLVQGNLVDMIQAQAGAWGHR